jgi:hypothetical protein
MKRKKNPLHRRAARLEFVRRGAKLYEDFSGHKARIVGKLKKPKIPDVLVNVGLVDFIGYTTVQDGRKEKYIHKFKPRAKPLFCVTPNGDYIYLLEGKYEFTEQGIVDRT